MGWTMKKSLSVLLSLALIISTLSIGFTAYADVIEEKAVESFVDNACEAIQEYDSNKALAEPDSDSNEPDFQTCRVIVKADGGFDDYGAEKHIKGFKDIHILQYENESSAKAAYNSLQNEKNVLSVSVDEVVAVLQGETMSDSTAKAMPPSDNGHLCDWATERTQSAQVIDYIEENNIPLTDITVGVIDDGVDYNHEFLKDRIVRTHFNSTADGTENDEYDLVGCHGTATSSVILDSTPDNVSVAVYRTVDTSGYGTAVTIQLGTLQAINDGVDVISMSLGYSDPDELTKAAVEYANEKNIPLVCSAGNYNSDVVSSLTVPAMIEDTISVTATNIKNRNCVWSNLGYTMDVSAPGEKVYLALPENSYGIGDGTSFSAPYVAGAVATMKSINSNYTIKELEDKLRSTATRLLAYNEDKTEEQSSNFNDRMPDLQYERYGSGIIQLGYALGIDSVPTPTVNYESGNYIDEVEVELNSEFPVYYTLDGSYPTTSSQLYTEPLSITKDTNLRAVAYDENSVLKYSTEFEGEYYIYSIGTDDMFEINENGCITAYNGDVSNLIVPERINGVEVTTFSEGIFSDGKIARIIFPDTLIEIPELAFSNNDVIRYVNSGGAKTVKQSAFISCGGIYKIDLPEVEIIEGPSSFSILSGLYAGGVFVINAPKLKEIDYRGFTKCSMFDLVAPNLETVYSSAFYSSNILYANFRNLTTFIKEYPFYPAIFEECCPDIIDMPKFKDDGLLMRCSDFYAQYINLPLFTGTITNYSDDILGFYNLLYYNITKESAEKTGITYYNADALGGSIRVTDAGLRFGFSYDETQTDKVDEYGFVYALGDVDPYTLYVEDVDNSSVYKLVANNRITHEDNTTTFNLVFTDIPNTSYDKQVSVRAYIKVDGNYYYSDKLCYSFNDIAQKVLSDNEIDQNTKNSLNNLLEV